MSDSSREVRESDLPLSVGNQPWIHVDVGGELERARAEWLHTNGAGGYASSTLAGMHTRRYHGLLVAALDPPRSRHVLLSHVDTIVTVSDNNGRPAATWEIAKHQFPGVDPRATPLHLVRFDQDPLPRWTYRVAGGELEVLLALVRGANAVVLRYRWRGPDPRMVGKSSAHGRNGSGKPASDRIMLSLRPLLAMRNFHHTAHEHGGMQNRIELRPLAADGQGTEVSVQPVRALPKLVFRSAGRFVGTPDWWRRFEYLVEHDRGLDFEEDLWTPGVFEVSLDAGAETFLTVGCDAAVPGEPTVHIEAAAAELAAQDPGRDKSPLHRRLSVAAEAFRADRAKKPGILAGYPWFEVWGRDTLIALPGLYLVTGRVDGAVRILREMFAVMKDGLVPNRIPDAGEAPEFHTADATLWLFEACRLVSEQLGERHELVAREMVPALRDAFEAALIGTRNAIHVTSEGMFAAGVPGDSLTWMDARVDGKPITSRCGCPVELTALWAKGCETLAHLARASGEKQLAADADAAAERARAAFAARFWCEATGFPYDVVSERAAGDGSFADPAIRPNAVVALAVDPACFSRERAAAVVARSTELLLTPAGLRTLAPTDPAYKGRYEGGVASRDGAYHQGTVWPWLLGFHVRAALRAAATRAEREACVADLSRLVHQAAANALAVGQVPEIADGDPPHRPAGCFAQAWSVAELLRAAAWDLT